MQAWHQQALNHEELFWKAKASTKYILDAYQNTFSFYATVKGRRSKAVSRLKLDGDWCDDKYVIHDHAVEFFKNEVSAKPCGEPDLFLNLSTKLLNMGRITRCYFPLRQGRRLKMMFSMCGDSAPGQDGLSIHFYVFCWDIVGKDIFQAAISFFFFKYTCQIIFGKNYMHGTED